MSVRHVSEGVERGPGIRFGSFMTCSLFLNLAINDDPRLSPFQRLVTQLSGGDKHMFLYLVHVIL